MVIFVFVVHKACALRVYPCRTFGPHLRDPTLWSSRELGEGRLIMAQEDRAIMSIAEEGVAQLPGCKRPVWGPRKVEAVT